MNVIRAPALIIWEKGVLCDSYGVDSIRVQGREHSRAWETEGQRETESKNMNTKIPNSEKHRRVKNVCTMIVSQIVLCVADDSS